GASGADCAGGDCEAAVSQALLQRLKKGGKAIVANHGHQRQRPGSSVGSSVNVSIHDGLVEDSVMFAQATLQEETKDCGAGLIVDHLVALSASA
ncbi:unnamed protein product, partial [Symbiodinium microadriaticum]